MAKIKQEQERCVFDIFVDFSIVLKKGGSAGLIL